MSTTSEAVVIGRRFQKVSSYHFSHQIKCVAPLGTEAVAVHCTEGSEHVTSVYPLTPHSNSQRKSAIERTVQRFLYVRKYRVYVMFCGDLSLRVFSDTFQHMQTIPTTSTALCMEFVEATSTLYIGQSGYIKAWHLGNQLYCPLEPESQSTVAVGKDEWVVGLDYELDTSRLAAATEKRVVIIDTKVHQEIATYHTGKCRDSITGAVLFSSLGYLVLAFRNGLIEVVNTALNSEVGELAGHIKPVTALKRHVTGSSLISCSLDGTVRVWSLETLVECNRLDLGVELLGLSVSGCGGGGDNVQLLVHSHQDISIWHLSQLETHFASVYSNTVALSRVESPDAARIMATAGDGSVRLISPATGEVITTFFPIFTADLLSEMVYCPLCGLLFALLSTGEVLVASALTNPCSTLQLWTSTHREKIETISTCMVEWKGKRQSLVFGGSVCGHILLLHSSLFTMEPPCPAHGGRVCKLISSASPVKLAAPYNSSTPHLLSLGSDNFLNSWSIRVNRKGDHVVLKMLTCIQMESVPAHVSLLDTLLCVATTRNTVEMVDLSPELMGGHQNPYLPQGLLFHSLPVMSHQREDRHSAAITSLSCCPQLRLFATTSLDGLLKVWSPSNSMVAEIDFGERLFTACFSNSRGDLLVGFQRQLCSVAASHYLPSSHLSLGHSPSCLLEEPIPFDPSLQFWYDPERVPSYPVQLEERKKHCSLLDDYCTSECPSKTLQQMESVRKAPVTDKRRRHSSTSEAVRVELVRQNSRHILASSVDVSTDVPPENSSLSSLREAIVSGLGAMKSHELARALVADKRPPGNVPPNKRLLAPVRKFPARVEPLRTPFSPSLPIAPDCLIPNSTLRGTIGYVPAPDPLSLLQQSAIDRILGTSPDSRPDLERLRGKRRRKKRQRRTVDGVGRDVGSRSESVSESDSGELYDDTEERDEISEEWVKSPDVVASSNFGSNTSLQCDESENILRFEGRSSPDVPVSVIESQPHKVYTIPQETESKFAAQPSSQYNTERYINPVRNNTEEKIESSKTVMSSINEPSNVSPPPPPPMQREPTAPVVVETKSVPTVTIPLHVGPPPKTTAAVKSLLARPTQNGSRGESVVAKSGVAEAVGLPAREPSKDVEDSFLQRVMELAHFPPGLRRTITTVQEVCDEMVSMLKCGDPERIRSISSAIVELKRDAVLTEAQQSALAKVLVTRLQSSTSSVSTRQAALLALERLGTPADDIALLAVLPHLLDSNVGVRKAAFSTLQAISGIRSRSELHHRLIEMGILQHIESDEDEILRALSRRLEGSRSRMAVDVTTHFPPIPGKQGATGEDARGGKKRDGNRATLREDKTKSIVGTKVENKPRERKRDENKKVEVTKESKNSKEDCGSSHGVSTAHLTTREGARGGKQSKRSLNRLVSRADDMAMFQARLRHQPVLHIITTTGGRQLRRGNQPGGRPFLPSYGHRAESKSNNLQRLLAAQPAYFSQSAPVREIMRGAYPTARGVGVERKERDFRWTEVFPAMMRRKQIESRGSASDSGPRTGDTHHCSKDGDAKCKLPKIL